jgi:peptidoglycan hydrolase CwlO-like protein
MTSQEKIDIQKTKKKIKDLKDEKKLSNNEIKYCQRIIGRCQQDIMGGADTTYFHNEMKIHKQKIKEINSKIKSLEKVLNLL